MAAPSQEPTQERRKLDWEIYLDQPSGSWWTRLDDSVIGESRSLDAAATVLERAANRRLPPYWSIRISIPDDPSRTDLLWPYLKLAEHAAPIRSREQASIAVLVEDAWTEFERAYPEIHAPVVERWRARAHASLRGRCIPVHMLGGLRKSQVLAWLARAGWRPSNDTSNEELIIWRSTPPDGRGVEVHKRCNAKALADLVSSCAFVEGREQWTVLDEMLALDDLASLATDPVVVPDESLVVHAVADLDELDPATTHNVHALLLRLADGETTSLPTESRAMKAAIDVAESRGLGVWPRRDRPSRPLAPFTLTQLGRDVAHRIRPSRWEVRTYDRVGWGGALVPGFEVVQPEGALRLLVQGPVVDLELAAARIAKRLTNGAEQDAKNFLTADGVPDVVTDFACAVTEARRAVQDATASLTQSAEPTGIAEEQQT